MNPPKSRHLFLLIINEICSYNFIGKANIPLWLSSKKTFGLLKIVLIFVGDRKENKSHEQIHATESSRYALL
jgi:hypothetical protein